MKIEIPVPCHEKWDEMNPQDKGRFCNACEKVVVDFTLMTNGEIVKFFNDASNSKVCGRFNSYQLNRPLEAEHKIPESHSFFKHLRKIAAIVVTGVTFFISSCNRKQATKGKPVLMTMAIDSNTSKTPELKDTVIKTRKIKQINHPKMGKAKVEIQGEVLSGVPEISMGGARPYVKEDEVLTGDTVIIKK